MKLRNTLLLALIVAAFGGYLYFVEKPAADREAEPRKLLSFDAEKVSGLTIEYPDRKIVLSRTGGTWRLAEPIQAEADQTTVNSLVRAIADAELKKTIDEKPENLATFGLDQPTAILTLTLEDGTAVPKLSVGKTTPIGFSAYARRGDEDVVLLTTAAFHSGVKKEVKDLRDKTVLTFDDDAVEEIRIASGASPDVVLKKDGAGWVVAGATPVKADVAQVRSYLASLRSLRAQEFVDEAKPPLDPAYGLTPPALKVTLVTGPERAEQTLLVGGSLPDAAAKQVYLERGEGGPVVTVGDHALAALGKRPIDFRDKTVIAFDKAAVARVVVSDADGGSFTLERKDGRWTLADAGDEKVKDLIIERYVDDLRTLKGSGIASETGPEPGSGFDHPKITATITGADGGTLGVLRIAETGSGKDKKILATAEGKPTVYTLNEYVLQRVAKRRADFIEAPPAAASGAAHESIMDGVGAPEDPDEE